MHSDEWEWGWDCRPRLRYPRCLMQKLVYSDDLRYLSNSARDRVFPSSSKGLSSRIIFSIRNRIVYIACKQARPIKGYSEPYLSSPMRVAFQKMLDTLPLLSSLYHGKLTSTAAKSTNSHHTSLLSFKFVGEYRTKFVPDIPPMSTTSSSLE
jgi:hypothetical protein